jgi:hypothetical protein
VQQLFLLVIHVLRVVVPLQRNQLLVLAVLPLLLAAADSI